MKLSRRAMLAGIAAAPLLGFARYGIAQPLDAIERAVEPMEPIAGAENLWSARLADGLWVYTGTAPLGDTMYPYNGMLAEDGDRSILIDTGWNNAHGRALLAWAEALGKPVRAAVATHFHADRTGGIAVMRRAGIPVLAHPMTTGLARALGLPEPDPLAELARRPVDLGPCELFHPGPGHSADNITVWHRPSRTLFGGCFIKAASATDLGNVEDAVVERWAASIATLQVRYPDIATTVPGHGAAAGDPLGRTLELLAAG